jgi:hypothetical protein
MLVNVVASAAAFQEPTILLNPLYDLAIFQILTATSLSRAAKEAARFYVEKLEPQPQDLVEWGLMKLKPWRMRVSS